MKFALAFLLLLSSGMIVTIAKVRSRIFPHMSPGEKMIDHKMIRPLNTDMLQLKYLKSKIKKKYPELKDLVKTKLDGFSCNKKFCRRLGAGVHGIGLCSPVACICDEHHNSRETICTHGLKFDPIVGKCNNEKDVKFCNLK